MQEVKTNTRILVIDADQTNFQVRHCIAQALGLLSSMELSYAANADEGLEIINSKGTDAIILSDESLNDKNFFLDNLSINHPPLILETSDESHFKQKQKLDQNIMFVPVYDTLEGMHQVLILAVSLAKKFSSEHSQIELH